MEKWQEAFILYCYDVGTNSGFKLVCSFEQYNYCVFDVAWFNTDRAKVFKYAYEAGYINGYSHGVHDA